MMQTCRALQTSVARDLHRYALAAAILLLIAGCIPIPPERAPFEEASDSIEIGITTRDEVESALGDPTVDRRNGKLAVYSEEQFGGGIFVLGAGVGVTGYHLIAISYDERGVVTSVEKRTSNPQSTTKNDPIDLCISSGECFRLFQSNTSINVERKPPTVVFADSDEDRIAKKFEPETGRCTIYLYYEPRAQDRTFQVIVDGRNLGLSTGDGYVRHETEPDLHEISNGRHDSESISFECAAGQVLFLKFYRTGWLEGLAPATVNEREGQTGVLDRKLVLLE